MRVLRRSLLLLSLATAACNFNPKVDGAKLICTANDDNACPAGYTCGADGHCCPGSAGTCSGVLADGGNQDLHDAAVSTGGSAAGGTTPSGGANGGGGTSVGSGGAGGGYAGSAQGGATAGTGGAVGGAKGGVSGMPGTGGRGGTPGSGGAAGNGGKPGAGGTGAPSDGGMTDGGECAPAPASCMGVTNGTLCMSNTVLSCTTNSKGCVSAAVTATCTTAKPCVVNGGAASCTCPAAPADCASAGTVCRTNMLATCGLDSSGCQATLSSVACPSPQTCGGVFPSAVCSCPAAPAECAGAASGSHCVSNTRITCTTDTVGCVTLASMPCGTAFCSGAYPGATCKTPISLGNSADLGSTDFHQANYLLGFKITASASTLYRFGILVPTSAATAGAHVQFGLYRDSAGAPTTLVAQTNGVALASGRNEFAPTVAGVALTAGDYWIMAVFDRMTDVRHDTTTVATWRYASFSYGTALPATLTTMTASASANINYYVLVY